MSIKDKTTSSMMVTEWDEKKRFKFKAPLRTQYGKRGSRINNLSCYSLATSTKAG